MIKLRHILHPFKSATSLYRRAETSIYRSLSDRAVSKIPRRDITRCWCGGSLKPLAINPQYGVCLECGCYVNLRSFIPESLKGFYSLENYWRLRQKVMGVPPIEKRAEVYRADGRLEYWLELIRRYGPSSGSVVEVGCAPGILLSELTRSGYRCVGVEADASVADWIRQNAKVEVREGIFPGVQLPPCDLLLAFDVAEHTPEPLAFWKGIADALAPDGVAIVQTPVERRDYADPFKTRRDFFDGVEHLYLYTDMSIRRLTQLANLELVALEDAIGTLGQVCVLGKRADAPAGQTVAQNRQTNG